MASSNNPLKDLTLLTVAVYFFTFAVCAKGVFVYASQHPKKEELLAVHGVISAVILGGQGDATSLQVKSGNDTRRYSSWYGKVWPGMELIQAGDSVSLLVERDTTNKNELFAGKRFYIWELTHQDDILIGYEDVRNFVRNTEAAANRYVNLCLVISFAFLVIAGFRRYGSLLS